GKHAQPLVLSALGGSPGGTVEGVVVRFPDLASLEQARPGSLAGKIAFVDYRMERARDGHGYGPASRLRRAGPSAATRAGASALGGSPGGTVEGVVVRFPDLASLEQARPGSLAGKIAFVDYRMERARDGHGYGPASRLRGAGPSAAIRAGASAFLMRSAGTGN